MDLDTAVEHAEPELCRQGHTARTTTRVRGATSTVTCSSTCLRNVCMGGGGWKPSRKACTRSYAGDVCGVRSRASHVRCMYSFPGDMSYTLRYTSVAALRRPHADMFVLQ